MKIPYVVQFTRTAAVGAIRNNLQFGMKNGFHQIIHSFSVDYQGTNVVQLTPFSNFYISYKMMTSWSVSDVAKYGALCNFFPDTSNATRYIATDAAGANAIQADGLGLSNNRITPVSLDLSAAGAFNTALLVQSVASKPFNEGYAKRLYNCNKVGQGLIAGGAGGFISGNLTNNLPSLNHYYSSDAGAGAAELAFVFHWATIRLKDMHDFFAQLPLVKGAYLKILVNYNAGSSVLTIAAAQDNVTNVTTTQQYGGSIPYMITSAGANQPNNALYADANIATATLISGVKTAGASTPQGSLQCRLYVPLYQMSPQYESQYISMNPTKEVVYRDIYNFNMAGSSAVGAGQAFNQLLTNGIVSPKALIIIPIVDGQTAGANKHCTAVALHPYQSPYTTEPATSSSGAALYNLNIQVSGVNIFQQNLQYDFEEFTSELSKINAVNGGMTTGLTSGLIGEDDFASIYRYYVADLSRGYKADDVVPKSILITGENRCVKDLTLFCFIEYERKIVIDIVSGAVVQV